MSIKIDVKRTGFPVKIGSLELWFDSSVENLRRFFDAEKIALERLKEVEKKARHVHFPEVEEINEDNIKDMPVETIDAALDLNKEYVAIQYDVIFGDGTFKKLYKEYPDVMALNDLIDPLGIAIAEKIEQQEEDRKKEVEKKKQEYLDKKSKKK